ncbi:MAG TPA: beta-ketoacyl-ACP synthase II [Terriglobales bacterium]|nr:beta-ketoacyl-ACP synthase II [Terriglobales bacterium]
MRHRVVVTGVGLISAVGLTAPETWAGLLAGRSGVGPITHFDASQYSCRFAAEVKGFDPFVFIEKKELKKMGLFIQFALAAAAEAMAGSGLQVSDELAPRVGVHIGSGIGGFDVIEREHSNLLAGGPRKVSPFFIPASIVNLAAGHVSIRYNARGPNSAACTACASGAHSIGDAFRLVQHGYADAMIAGGAEAAITPLSVAGFASMKALSTRNDDPARASRPFDLTRDGFVIGEGGGMLVLEELEFARRRGAAILAEVVGYGMSADAFHITMPAETGEGAFRAMEQTLADARVAPGDVDYINAHGTSTAYNDKFETMAIKRLLGGHAHKVAISSTKSMTGHLLGGAGGLEAGISVLALRHQVAPPTAHYETPDPDCDLDYVPLQPRPLAMRYALSNSFGFGGTNAALLFKKWEG